MTMIVGWDLIQFNHSHSIGTSYNEQYSVHTSQSICGCRLKQENEESEGKDPSCLDEDSQQTGNRRWLSQGPYPVYFAGRPPPKSSTLQQSSQLLSLRQCVPLLPGLFESKFTVILLPISMKSFSSRTFFFHILLLFLQFRGKLQIFPSDMLKFRCLYTSVICFWLFYFRQQR